MRVPWACGSEAAGGDVAVGGGGVDLEEVGVGAGGVGEGVVDAAVGGGGVEGGAGGVCGADGDRAGVGVQGERSADGFGDLDRALAGADLGGAGEPADGDFAGAQGEVGGGGLVEFDGGLGGFEGDFAEASDPAQFAGGEFGLDPGAGRESDGDLEGAGRAEGAAGCGGGLQLRCGPLRPEVVSDSGNATLRSRFTQQTCRTETELSQRNHGSLLQRDSRLTQRRRYHRCNGMPVNAIPAH